MLARWGSIVYAHRLLVVALSALALVLSIGSIVAFGASLSASGFIDTGSESARVDRQLADQFGRGRSSLVYLFDARRPVADPAVRGAIETPLAPLAADQRVVRVLTPWNSGNPRMVSTDGRSAYAVALLTLDDDQAQANLDRLRRLVVVPTGSGLTVSVTGGAAIGEAISNDVGKGIARAESVAVPLTILIQLAVFGGLLAAGVPLLVGGLAIVGSLAVIFGLSHATDQSVFAANIITMLGLGLGVDYSLFMVARFREEVERRPVPEAVAVSLATVGKAILFSGITVIFGLAATQFFPLAALRSMGQAGMVVVALALLYGLTFLPALLALLGTRINAVRIGLPRRGRTPGDRRAAGGTPFWGAVARQVMRHPLRVLLPVLAALLVAGIPFLWLRLTPGGPDVLPAGNPARTLNDRLNRDFPAGESEPIPVIVRAADGNALSPASRRGLDAFVRTAEAIPGVVRVESVVSDDAAVGFDWSAYRGDPATLPPALRSLAAETLRPDAIFVRVVTSASQPGAERVVRELRQRGEGLPGVSVAVGGFAASSVDTVDGIKAGAPIAVLFVVVGSYLILLLTFGSVFLPLKAIFMTLLSISASLGAVVFVFQEGHLSGPLGFTATGEIISTTPILMFCILFGLSMDYEVLMLSRVQEEYARTGDNTASVAFGLERTAKVITGAAGIMIVVFAGFMLAGIVIIKSMGFGLAVAVLVDATIVRGLLVPATMRLMGRWNWWAPASIRRVVDRLGLTHAAPAHLVAAGD